MKAFELQINQKKFRFSEKIIKATQIRSLVKAPENYVVCCNPLHGGRIDYVVDDLHGVDLTQPGRNNFLVYSPNSTEG